MEIDLGDIVFVAQLRIKGRRLGMRWHIGPTVESTKKGQTGPTPKMWFPTRKADVYMDLMADQQVTVSLEFTDEMGNPTDQQPGDVSATFSVDRTDLISLTDNGDGTCVAAAVGTLGAATLHADVTSNGQQLTGDLQINVVAGLAERVNIVAGAPEEVTPDTRI